MSLLEASDLAPFVAIPADKAEAMIEDATATAVAIAPCLSDPDELSDNQRAAAKAILRGAVLRWNESGSGAVSSQNAGPFSMSIDTRQTRRSLFWPSEIDSLQQVCKTTTTSGAFSIDTAPPPIAFHSSLCGFGGGCPVCDTGP